MARSLLLLGSLLLLLLVVVTVTRGDTGVRTSRLTEEEIGTYLSGDYENNASDMCNTLVKAEWDYNTDLGNPNKEQALVDASLASAAFEKEQWDTWFKDADWENFQDPEVKRQTMFRSVLGTAALDTTQLEEYNQVLNSMTGVYGSARICPYDKQNCDLATEGWRLEPEMEERMAKSNDYDELEYVWSEWRAQSGAKIRDDYVSYVQLSNDAAQANDFADMGEMWRADYETEDFEAEMERLWLEVKPLYDRLHKYVHGKLKEKYGDKMPDGTYIPAHILGNMWAQSWENLYDLLVPFPDATKIDITQSMIDQGYTVPRMFTMADNFYTSMGLPGMEVSFNPPAIIERPNNREIVCHASAWDFCDKTDFRIKMCTNVDEEDFITIHHELGHIQYFLQYKDQPITFRKGANPGFHEAVGDVIALSVSTPEHYKKIGLLHGYETSSDNTINAQLRSALSKVVFLPFAMVIDSWRWGVFRNNITQDEWNAKWWALRLEYQMITPPNARPDPNFFDPGAKYHVPGNSQYINYFVAHILQFQIHRALCIEAGEFDPLKPSAKPLHTCDIFNSVRAGAKLKKGLMLGGSKHWSEALKELTGEENLSGQALLEFYAPLDDWLKSMEPVDQTVPIVVGAILGTVAIVALVAYFVKEYRTRKKNKDEEAATAAAPSAETQSNSKNETQP